MLWQTYFFVISSIFTNASGLQKRGVIKSCWIRIHKAVGFPAIMQDTGQNLCHDGQGLIGVCDESSGLNSIDFYYDKSNELTLKLYTSSLFQRSIGIGSNDQLASGTKSDEFKSLSWVVWNSGQDFYVEKGVWRRKNIPYLLSANEQQNLYAVPDVHQGAVIHSVIGKVSEGYVPIFLERYNI